MDGQLDAADRLYLLALRRDPGDARAATGLVYDRARRLMAQKVVDEAQRLDEVRHADTDAIPGRARAATKAVEDCFEQARLLDGDNEPASEGPPDAPQDKTFAAIAADRWEAFYVAWIEPAGRALLPLLAALATQFVLARLVTPVVVSVDGWRGRPVDDGSPRGRGSCCSLRSRCGGPRSGRSGASTIRHGP